MKILKKGALLAAVEPMCFMIGVVATFISAITIILTGHTLTPENAFMLLVFIDQTLRRAIAFKLTFIAPLLFESLVSLTRAQKFLLLQNLHLGYQNIENGCTRIYGCPSKDNGYHPLSSSSEDFPLNILPKRNPEKDVCKTNDFVPVAEGHSKEQQIGLAVSGATCSTTGSCEKCILCEVSFDAPAESLTVITGQVGSGKSTLLYAIAGELALSSGTISLYGTIAYVSQQSWVFSGTIRDNILFCKMYDESKFAKVIQVCALQEVGFREVI